MIFKKILIPVDFSDFSNKAMEFGLQLAEKFQAKIELLHVVVLFQDDIDEESRLQEYESWIKRREEKIRQQLKASEKLANQKDIEITTTVLRGISAADAILDHIDENPPELIVMGTHGRSGLKHFLQGSVAEKVVRLSRIPVLTVHRSITQFRIKRILVPIDFSIYSKSATDFACVMAKQFGAALNFLHVIEQDIHPSFYASGVTSIFDVDPGLKERVTQNMKEFLKDQLEESQPASYHAKEGKAHREIVEFAKENETDLVIIATHGLTGLDYILLGSTAEKVVRWANCPVLTVKRMEAD